MKPAAFTLGPPALALALLFAVPLLAQDNNIEQAKKILDSYHSGKFEEVVKLANEFIQAKPQDQNLPNIYRLLASSYYNLGKWTDAVPAYRKVQTLSTEKDVKEDAGYCLAQSLANQADASLEKSADRKKYLEEAIQLTGEFGKTFPDSKSLAEILLLQARLHVQQGKYAEASKDLDAARKADTEKNLGEELDYLQGFAEAQRARELLAEFKKADGEAAVARASQIYARIASAGNPALATEAALQLANLDMAAGRYNEAIDRLRTIPGRVELLARLEGKLAPLRAEVASQSTPAPEKLRRIQKAQQKIEEIKNRPDLSGQALFQLGQAFLQTRRYDEARLVFRQITRYGSVDLVGPAEQQIILTFALQGRTGEADRLVEEYRKKYPSEKGIEGLVDYLVGRALLEDGDYEGALRRLKSAQEKITDDRYADEIPRFIATAYQKSGKGAEALKYYESFLADVKSGKRKVSEESAEQTQLLYATALIAEKKFPEGIAKLTELSTTAKTSSVKEDAALRLGYALRTSQKFVEAAGAFEKFAAAYPQSPSLGSALLARGDALNDAKKPEEALAAWKEATTKLAGSPSGLEAYERIWKNYAREKKKDLMFAAQEDQFRTYPKDPRNLSAYLARGTVFTEERDESQALQAYRRAFELFRELYPDPSVTPPPASVSDAAYSALEKSADLELTKAKALGTYSQLSDDAKKQWKTSIQQGTDFLSQAILGYSSARVAPTLSKLVNLCLFRLQSGEAPVDECLQPFRNLAGKASQNPGLVAQILFSQASVPFEAGQTDLALRLYEEAYKQSLENKVTLDWRDLQRFANALLAAGKGEEARPVFERIRKEFPVSGPKDPKQYAQASALFGLGQIDFQAGRKAESEKYFSELATKYPWSDKLQEANFLRAQALAEAGKYDGTKSDPGAFDLWIGVIESGNASNEMKARSMLAFGQSLENVASKNISTRQLDQGVGKAKLDPLDLAVTYYQKIDLYYDSLPELSAQGLLRAAKIRRGQQKNDEARKIVTTLLSKYGNSSVGSEAAEILKSLPASSGTAPQ